MSPTHCSKEELVREIATLALARVQRGECSLAFHPHCGSSFFAALVLSALATVAAGGVGLGTHLPLSSLALVTAALFALTALLVRPIGLWLQRTVTVATRFQSGHIVRVRRTVDTESVAYKVHVLVTPLPEARSA